MDGFPVFANNRLATHCCDRRPRNPFDSLLQIENEFPECVSWCNPHMSTPPSIQRIHLRPDKIDQRQVNSASLLFSQSLGRRSRNHFPMNLLS
ncbi:hypothetical protein [Paraburkholderia sp. Cpub6]|uniref:hypothetical protein n=1 Tax=Paraburkholderia sp. Cpub6 TaxID=2723094 RepID=UPI001615F943|nr:hypothetical protein [Paraburkholderia sp. Cpub6]MBB5462277.1 hypothetical protein [Paraburkholderia sp. Cpub6]